MITRRQTLKLLGLAGLASLLPAEFWFLPQRASQTLSFGLPQPVTSGNLLVAMVASRAEVSISGGGGWTSIGTVVEGDLRGEIWYELSSAASESAHWNSSAPLCAFFAEFTNPNSLGPITLVQSSVAKAEATSIP